MVKNRLKVNLGLILAATVYGALISTNVYAFGGVDLFGAERLANHPDGCPPKAICTVEPQQSVKVAWCEIYCFGIDLRQIKTCTFDVCTG